MAPVSGPGHAECFSVRWYSDLRQNVNISREVPTTWAAHTDVGLFPVCALTSLENSDEMGGDAES